MCRRFNYVMGGHVIKGWSFKLRIICTRVGTQSHKCSAGATWLVISINVHACLAKVNQRISHAQSALLIEEVL